MVEGEPTLRFRYVVIADPHLSTPTGENVDRLDRAVAWIGENADALDLRLVLVVGDIAWGDGLDAALASLDRLPVTWVPINGDNEVSPGSEERYATTFAEHYAAWRRRSTPGRWGRSSPPHGRDTPRHRRGGHRHRAVRAREPRCGAQRHRGR